MFQGNIILVNSKGQQPGPQKHRVIEEYTTLSVVIKTKYIWHAVNSEAVNDLNLCASDITTTTTTQTPGDIQLLYSLKYMKVFVMFYWSTVAENQGNSDWEETLSSIFFLNTRNCVSAYVCVCACTRVWICWDNVQASLVFLLFSLTRSSSYTGFCQVLVHVESKHCGFEFITCVRILTTASRANIARLLPVNASAEIS